MERRGEEEYLGKEVSIKEFVDKEQKTPGVQECRSSRVQESGVQESRSREFRSPGVKESGVQELRSSRVQEFRSSRVQEFRSQESKSSGVQEFRRPGVVGKEYIDRECGVQGQVLVNKVFQEPRRAESQEFRNRG